MTFEYYSEIEPRVHAVRRENNTLPGEHTYCLDPDVTSSAKCKSLESSWDIRTPPAVSVYLGYCIFEIISKA